jgi:hypothetical protein
VVIDTIDVWMLVASKINSMATTNSYHKFKKLAPSHIEICWQNANLLTREICLQNLLTKNESADDRILLTESADKKESADHKKPCRLGGSKLFLKTSDHTSQAMAGAHIASVKFNAWMCAWAGPSCSYTQCTIHERIIGSSNTLPVFLDVTMGEKDVSPFPCSLA